MIPPVPMFGASGSIPKGVIVLWSGAIASIPAGWAICDGTNGTPNLRDRFVVGAGTSYAVGAAGGNVNHNHGVTDPGHTHNLNSGTNISVVSTGNYSNWTATITTGITVNNADGRPPYYALAYIMKL